MNITSCYGNNTFDNHTPVTNARFKACLNTTPRFYLAKGTLVCSRTPLNPLTTNDTIWHHLNLAARYKLVQSVLKVGFALAQKVK